MTGKAAANIRLVRVYDAPNSRLLMVDPHLVDSISWENHGVWIHLPKESIEQCEEFVASN